MSQLRCASTLTAILVAAASVSGCALLPHSVHWAKVRPVQIHTAGQADEDFYASAKTEINRGDYGQAIDYLEAAKARDPNDVRVLNALGVVYDKLGRFDLSGRYYALAEAADPGSPIVRRNLAYSARLQQVASAPKSPAPEVAAAPERDPQLGAIPASPQGPRLVAAGPNVLRLELPASAAVELAALPTLPEAVVHPVTPPTKSVTGYPLLVLNHSGADKVGVTVVASLARRGWTIHGPAPMGPRLAVSRIVYSPDQTVVARALAKTLSGGPKLELCTEDCRGVKLILGADASAWISKPAGGRKS